MDNEYCYECEAYGDDYSIDEWGNLVCNCYYCPYNGYDDDFDYED